MVGFNTPTRKFSEWACKVLVGMVISLQLLDNRAMNSDISLFHVFCSAWPVLTERSEKANFRIITFYRYELQIRTSNQRSSHNIHLQPKHFFLRGLHHSTPGAFFRLNHADLFLFVVSDPFHRRE